MFGWKITAIYIGFGLAVAIIGGIVLGRMSSQNEILIEIKPISGEIKAQSREIIFSDRMKEAAEYTKKIFLRKIWLYVLLGVGAGAFIHGYVPTEFVASVAGSGNPFAVPIATLLGVPMYSNAAGVMPLIEVLTAKRDADRYGSQLYDGSNSSCLPEAMILKRVKRA